MRRRKNLLRHRMRSNGGNTYKSREKGAHCRRLMACLGRRIVATCTRIAHTQGCLSEGLGMRRPLHRSRIFKQPRADLQEEIIDVHFRARTCARYVRDMNCLKNTAANRARVTTRYDPSFSSSIHPLNHRIMKNTEMFKHRKRVRADVSRNDVFSKISTSEVKVT